MRLERDSRFFVFSPPDVCGIISSHALVRLLFSFWRLNPAICVCNLTHNDFLDSLDLVLWACGKHDFLFLWFSVYSSLYQYLPRVELVWRLHLPCLCFPLYIYHFYPIGSQCWSFISFSFLLLGLRLPRNLIGVSGLCLWLFLGSWWLTSLMIEDLNSVNRHVSELC